MILLCNFVLRDGWFILLKVIKVEIIELFEIY